MNEYPFDAAILLHLLAPLKLRGGEVWDRVDTMGYGIRTIHVGQVRRYLPMPDYELNVPDVVKMTLYGTFIDPDYGRLLLQKTDLPIEDILALDRVQKQLTIGDEMLRKLRRQGLVEGRKPNLYVSASVAKVVAKKADYIKNRAQDDDYYCKLITDYLRSFGQASRGEIDKLLANKLSDALDVEQKINKVSNLLAILRRRGTIVNKGSKKSPSWELAE